MKTTIFLLLGLLCFTSCQLIDNDPDLIPDEDWENCRFETKIFAPPSYQIDSISKVPVDGSVQSFQFVNENVGFALASLNRGGYVEVFKTIDGGQNWTSLDLGIAQLPKNMAFKDEKLGVISVHDVRGCPDNCQDRTVILKTENGGQYWEEVEYDKLKGILYHPTFGPQGNLYAYLSLDDWAALMISRDNAQSWDTLYSSPELGFLQVSYSFELAGDRIYASGKDGKILILDTDGNLIRVSELNDSPIRDVEIINNENLIVALGQQVIRSTDGGQSWSQIYDKTARMIGFDSAEEGLIIGLKSVCPGDIYWVNDFILATSNGGQDWIEPEKTTTNMRINFANSQQMTDDSWRLVIDNELYELR